MRSAEDVCTELIVNSHLLRKDLPELKIPALRSDVQARLEACGLELVEPAYSEYYSVRPRFRSQEVNSEQATNLGLKENELAMLVILWCKLALPKRLKDHPGPHKVHPNTIQSEFGEKFGGSRFAQSAITRLERLSFVQRDDGFLIAGPAMETLLDGSVMVDAVNRRALLVEARDQVLRLADDHHIGPTDIVRQYMKASSDWLYPRDVASELRLDNRTVQDVLRTLHKDGVLEHEGRGRSSRYRVKQ